MYRTCRYAAAVIMMAVGMAPAARATGDADGGLEARLRALEQRFESRRVHSAAARLLRTPLMGPDAAANDIQVNNDGFGGTSNQTQTVVGRRPDRGTITVWTDDRDANLSVYGQVFDVLGQPEGPNFRLHSDPSNYSQSQPAIVVRPDGGFYGAFTEVRASGRTDVIVQRFSRLGQPLGAAVNAAAPADTGRIQRRSALGLLSNGRVLVLYEQDGRTTPNSGIYGQFMAANLAGRSGAKFVVTDDLLIDTVRIRYDEREPSLAVGVGDTIWAVWTDNRDGGARDVFMRRFVATGNQSQPVAMLGAQAKVNDEPLAANAFQNTPRIKTAPDGSALIVWADFRNQHWDVYKQAYSASGTRIGVNERVNAGDLSGADQVQPAIAWADTAGVVVWKDFRGGTARTYAQRYLAGGSAWGVNFAVGPPATPNQSSPGVALIANGGFAVVWTQPVSAQSTAYVRLVDSANALGAVQPAADIVISARQVRPACAMSSTGEVFGLWEESRAALPNIVGQALDVNLAKPQGDRQVNGGAAAFHFLPTAAVGGSTGFAVWEDYRDTLQPVYSDIFLQRFSLTASGYTASGSNVRVIDTVESQDVRLASWNPDIAADGAGNAMVVWQDNRFRSWDILAARYSLASDPSTGNPVPIGRNFRVDQDPLLFKQELPRIDMNSAGQTVVVWEDTRAGSYDFQVWARLYTGAGETAAGAERRLELEATHVPRQPDVAIAADGGFAVVYEEHSDPADVNIYFQRFDATGGKIAGAEGNAILVNDDGLGVQQYFPRLAATSQGYVVTWQDERSGNWDIYAALIATGGSVAHANYSVVDDPLGTDQTVPAIAAVRTTSMPFICWEDLRDAETAPDIFGNRNAATLASGVEDDGQHLRPERFTLAQNYPNPFNPTTEIRFDLPRPAQVEVTVYNALGQRVRALASGPRSAGPHTVIWDGHNDQGRPVASGAYFYRLRWPGGEIARKMTLLR